MYSERLGIYLSKFYAYLILECESYRSVCSHVHRRQKALIRSHRLWPSGYFYTSSDLKVLVLLLVQIFSHAAPRMLYEACGKQPTAL